MRKFYTKDSVVYEFESDGSQDHLITADFTAMSEEEVDRHLNPEKYMTEEELKQSMRQRMPELSKRQFALYLYDHNMYSQVMQTIEANQRFKIEYESVSSIERLSPTILEIATLLGWSDDQVDQMWEHALTF